jgi:hypothetical protein
MLAFSDSSLAHLVIACTAVPRAKRAAALRALARAHDPSAYEAFRDRRNADWRAWKARHRRGGALAKVECGPRRVALLERLGLVSREHYPDNGAIGVALEIVLDVLEDWIANTPEGARWAAQFAPKR